MAEFRGVGDRHRRLSEGERGSVRRSSGSGPETGPGERGSPREARSESRSGSPEGRADLDLVEEARSGSHAAFEQLVRRYSERGFRVAFRVVRDTEAAEDVLQEAFLKAYRGLRRFECRSGFYTWFYRIVVNLALDRRRRDRNAPAVEIEDRSTEGADVRATLPEAEDPERTSRRQEIRKLVARGIETLPDGQREVLLLREVDGLSYEEIAAAMRISKGTVMSRLHYARRKMVAFLRQHGVDPEDAA